MRRKGGNHSASFIAVRGEKTLAERTQQYDVHPIRTRIDEAGWWATPNARSTEGSVVTTTASTSSGVARLTRAVDDGTGLFARQARLVEWHPAQDHDRAHPLLAGDAPVSASSRWPEGFSTWSLHGLPPPQGARLAAAQHPGQRLPLTSAAFTDVLKGVGVAISMDGKGRGVNNGFVERRWRSVKYEEVYLHACKSVTAARAGLSRYFRFYNAERRHQGLERRIPDAVHADSDSWPKAA